MRQLPIYGPFIDRCILPGLEVLPLVCNPVKSCVLWYRENSEILSRQLSTAEFIRYKAVS